MNCVQYNAITMIPIIKLTTVANPAAKPTEYSIAPNDVCKIKPSFFIFQMRINAASWNNTKMILKIEYQRGIFGRNSPTGDITLKSTNMIVKGTPINPRTQRTSTNSVLLFCITLSL